MKKDLKASSSLKTAPLNTPPFNIPPKWLERLAMFFPFLHGIVISYQGFLFLKNPGLVEFFLLVIGIYIFPLVLSRLLKLFFSLKRGVCRIGALEAEGNFWIIIHRLQFLFITFDLFEKILILIPGVFSLWLRAWGSQIGKRVLWTPRVKILDRTDLVIGDYCFIGDESYLSSHFITRKAGKLFLYYDQIKIGDRVLIGAHCHLGPGVRIVDHSFIPSYSKAMKTKRSWGV